MSKETRETAYDIIARWKRDVGQVVKYEQMIADVDKALRDERERCAKIAESHSATDCDGPDCGVVIAAAIRTNGVADAK